MKYLLFIMLLLSSPAWAQTKLTPKAATRVDNCAPIGRTADGQLVYSLRCENLPLPALPPPQAEVGEQAVPATEPEVKRSGIFGWSYETKRPEQ
jgi:hypothetical protein